MSDLGKQFSIRLQDVSAIWQTLQLDSKVASLQAIQAQLADPHVWDDSNQAQDLSRQQAKLQSLVEPWRQVKAKLEELAELANLDDPELHVELETQLCDVDSSLKNLKTDLQFSGPYDDHDAIIRLSAGAGGTDAQDWAEMLERMYLRWAEKHNLKSGIIERAPGEEAGIKSASLSVNGTFVYGKLKSEHGVHRLVRLSPYNADQKRQTSFALVEVLPVIDTPDEVVIDDKDLKIDVYRAGGHGGQSVNTTDSAVRITHIPTGITVAIQNERSQLQNKETAMQIIRSKLAQLQLEQHAEKVSQIKGPNQEAAWGNQIRNYVLHPYTMVKDTRTKYEETDASSVLDGKIDGFITAYLEQNFNQESV